MAATVPYPDMAVQLAMGARPNSSDNPQWMDVTELVVSADQISRGHPYQVTQGQASTPRVTLRDPLELFNPGRTGGPFKPDLGGGIAGRAVQPYRGICWQAMHPRGGTGNLLNSGTWRVPIDPSFESYATGSHPSWVIDFGITSTIGTGSPPQGAKQLSWPVVVSGNLQAVGVDFPAIPGRYYIVSVSVRQSAANTLFIALAGHGDLATTTATATTVRLSGVIWADQPTHRLMIGNHSTTGSGTVIIDAIQVEPVTPVNPNTNFNGTGGLGSIRGYTGVGGARLGVTADQASYHLQVLTITPDGVGTPKAQSPMFAVSPNTAYALHAALNSITDLGVNRQVTVWWYTAGQVFISSSSVTLALNAGSEWVDNDPLLAVTSPGTAAFAQIGTEGAAAVTSAWMADHIDLLPATPSAFTTSGPVIYPVLRQFAERWPRRYESNGFEGFADLQLVDAFAALNAAKVSTDLKSAVLRKSPKLYYPMWEQQGAAVLADASGNGGPLLRLWQSQVGPGTIAQPVAGTANNCPGDPQGTGVQFGGDGGASGTSDFGWEFGAGPAFQSTPISFPGNLGSNWGCTFMAWIRASYPWATTPDGFIVKVATFLPTNSQQLAAGSLVGITDGSVDMTWFGPNGSFVNIPGGAVNKINDGKGHLILGTVSQTVGGNTVLSLYVDGVFYRSSTVTTASVGLLTTDSQNIMIGGRGDGLTSTEFFQGLISDVALWDRVLTPSEITDLANAAAGYVGEVTGTRLSRRLTNNAGYPAGQNNNVPANRISAGRSIFGPSSSPNRTPALADAQAITLAEMGTLWIAPDGALVMESRDDRFLRTTPGQTFGEDFSGGECPYLPGVWYDFDPLYLYADVQVTQNNGIIATGGRTADINTARSAYFGRSYSPGQDLDLRDASMTQDYADWVFYTHNTPTQRIDSITIDPMSNPALWPVVFNAEIGQRILVKRRPQGLAGPMVISGQYFIEQIVHGQINVDSSQDQPWSWRTKLSLTPAPASAQPWILNDATYSVLGSTTRLGF